MNAILILEQSLNGLQFGLMLFLLAAGLTLVFGIMDMINLAHGSLYMIGAYLVATFTQAAGGSFWLGLCLGILATVVVGVLLECTILRRLYHRDHLSQVMGTFAILLMSNEIVRARIIWGAQPLMLNPPEALAGPVQLMSGFSYPAYRLLIIAVGLLVALLLWLLVTRTRFGMQVRAGAANREMATAMGANVRRLFTLVFALGAALCAVAGGDAWAAAGGSGRHGREHFDSRVCGDRDWRHRLDPRRTAGGFAGGRGRYGWPNSGSTVVREKP